MKIAKMVSEVRDEVQNIRKKGEKIGLVPTMGYLHKGHISLVRKSMEECSRTVVSIFVNPTQFGPSEDYNTYPRNPEMDIDLLKKEGVDILFIPSVEEMYEKNAFTSVEVPDLSKKLEGSIRPGHFRGVCTVVCKLFNIVSPDSAYFGWKDAQQLLIIKKMARDLNIPVEIKGCPTLRENDGLAISSRNVYIPAETRGNAVALYRGLSRIKEMAEKECVRKVSILAEEGRKVIENFPGVEIQYLEIVDADNLDSVKTIEGKVLALGAVRMSGIRLIDNVLIDLKST
ncbi:MAG TPA: pantoate--beta-alanine ligase [bacterium]|nr:pantoate--beta-alanine ligase [bacterium]